jgi:drug/metabolite transporter (DMT)-like permease
MRRFVLSNGTIFLLFAVGIALRDVISERFFPEDSACLAFLVCTVIAGISGLMTILGHHSTTLGQRLREPSVLRAVLALSVMATAIYAVTFYMLSIQTAGPFDLLDYGIAPLLTAAIGFVRLGEPLGRRFAVSVALFVAGMLMVAIGREHARTAMSLTWLAIAMVSPVATAISDAASQWLLKVPQLRREEVLFCRFAPASAILFVYIITAHPGGLHLDKGVAGLFVAVVLGFGPLYLLCTGLGRAALSQYAAYEALIPALVFFGTLPMHPGNRTVTAVIGAVLVLFGAIISEGSLLEYFRTRAVPSAAEPANG